MSGRARRPHALICVFMDGARYLRGIFRLSLRHTPPVWHTAGAPKITGPRQIMELGTTSHCMNYGKSYLATTRLLNSGCPLCGLPDAHCNSQLL